MPRVRVCPSFSQQTIAALHDHITKNMFGADLDVIMVPAFLHAASMQCMAASTCEHQVTNLETGKTGTEAGFTSVHNLFMHSLSHKHIPFGKVMVPTGLDELGRYVRADAAAPSMCL